MAFSIDSTSKMSASWSQGMQQPMGQSYSGQHSDPPGRRNTYPAPVCFRCGGPHFLISCPGSSQSGPVSSSAPPPATYQQFPGPVLPAQQYQVPPATPQQYPNYPQNQQNGPSTFQQPYNQLPRTFSTPPATPQYSGPGYHTPVYNHSSGPTQYGNSVYQAPPEQFGPPAMASYQPPYVPQNTGYHAAPAPYQAPPLQWNSLPTASRPPYQQPQHGSSAYSNTPSHHSQQQSQPRQNSRATSQHESDVQHQTPQTPASIHSTNGPAAGMTSHISSHNVPNEISALSNISTVRVVGSPAKQITTMNMSSSKEQDDRPEEGEVTEETDEEEMFEWESKHIFKEPQRRECVALAQPLSTSFKATPVPLVQAWSANVPSISRYARKDNLKEYVKDIRTSPQWPYLQEDPAFSHSPLDDHVIPLDQLEAWISERRGTTITTDHEDPKDFSRKRSRSHENEVDDEQDDIDIQIKHETASDLEEGPPNKRQKNDEDSKDIAMGTPDIMTPLLENGRGGTPHLAQIEDAWAPQPGETAALPPDPTEILLASLGVSGEAKPVKQTPASSFVAPLDDESRSSRVSQTPVEQNHALPGNGLRGNGPHINNSYNIGAQIHAQPAIPPDAQYVNGHEPPTSQHYNNIPPPNIAQGPSPYGTTAPAQYGTEQAPNAGYANPPFGPPADTQYGNMPPNFYQSPSQPQWGPSRSNLYGNAPPYAGQQGQNYSQYPPSANYPQDAPYVQPHNYIQSYPPQITQGPPQSYPYESPQGPPQGQQPYGQAPVYGNDLPTNYPQGPSPYGPPPNPSLANGHLGPASHGTSAQFSPSLFGLPQNMPYSADAYPYPAQHAGGGAPQTIGQHPNPHHRDGPPTSHSHLVKANENIPRQSSSYVSAGGGYSNGSGPDCASYQYGYVDGAFQRPPNSIIRHDQQAVKKSSVQKSGTIPDVRDDQDTSPDGTPLSPTSAEILGKLVRSGSDAKSETPVKETTVRKVKRPQPVVAEAYSRRW